jgi:hypothetical protein
MTITEHQDTRTYGGWIKPKGFGVFGLGTIGSAAGGLIIIIGLCLEMFLGLKVVAVWLCLALPPLGLFWYHNKSDRDGWQIIGGHGAWMRRKVSGTHIFLRGRIGLTAHGKAQLPGFLAKSELLYAEDVYGNPFGIVKLGKHYSVMVKGAPDGSAPVGDETHNTWVAYYGQWLAHLGYEESLVGASFTVQTSPDPGHRLAGNVARLSPPNAPDLTKRVLGQVLTTYPRGEPSVHAHATITYNSDQLNDERELSLRRDKEEKRPRNEGEMGALIAERLPAMLADLGATGVSGVRAMTPDEIAEYVRAAYSPEDSSAIDAARARGESAGITWADAGPMGTHCGWLVYRHGDAGSITYEMVEPPDSAVQSTILQPLLGAHDKVDIKRVTMLYRPHPAHKAPKIADRDRRTAFGIATERPGEAKADAEARLAAARSAAKSQQAGAGLCRFAMLVTATSNDADDVRDAGKATKRLGRSSQVGLRACRGVGDSAFVGALGIGLHLVEHTRLPNMREWS